MSRSENGTRYLLCNSNEDYPVALESRKVYQILPDPMAGPQLVRIIDETGEDYLFPASLFVPIEAPEKATSLFAPSKPGKPS